MKINKVNFLKALAVLEGFIIIALAVTTILLAVKYNATVPANANTDIRIRPYIDKEQTFYQLDGKKILTHNDTMGETFMPVFSDVPASTIIQQDIQLNEKGYAKYVGNEGLASKVGIDISEHQGAIDWEKVKSSGIDFAMIRVGYRTYGGGIITLDNNLLTNLDEASAAGLDIGVYFFLRLSAPMKLSRKPMPF